MRLTKVERLCSAFFALRQNPSRCDGAGSATVDAIVLQMCRFPQREATSQRRYDLEPVRLNSDLDFNN